MRPILPLLLTALCTASVIPGQTVSHEFAPLSEPLPNPMKGFYAYADTFLASPNLPQTLFYDQATWRELERDAPGVIRWQALEDGWEPHLALGRRVAFRIHAASPWSGVDVDIPDWLASQMTMASYEIDGAHGLSPDWNSEAFLSHHDRLIAALGERYNGDPRVAWVEIGSYGFWGEWHLWSNPHLTEATEENKRRLVNAYFQAFPDTPLVIAFDDPVATEMVLASGNGVRNDCLGTADSNDWFDEFMGTVSSYDPDASFHRSFITGEFCGSSQGATEGILERHDLNLDFILRHHWSAIGPAGGVVLSTDDEALIARAAQWHRRMGYRFRLDRVALPSAVSPGASFEVDLTLTNEGNAPFYLCWTTELALLDAEGSLIHRWAMSDEWDARAWLPGECTVRATLAMPEDADAGGEIWLGLAIIDPATNAPGVHFASEGRGAGGWHRLAPVTLIRE